eukprot:NODE_1252_length_1192_cov_337.811785.p1 GENE.NODE_1252_length_1192_cov_337.811785~~NODE_1252_length_1192_cov_337.811785.p1  ORF type:complete len:229 (-),score=70.53 NODE_1252_length_1192_cov_337.811785:489-1076(-)
MFGFVGGWVRELLSLLGVLSRKRAKICFLGLDNAGKTTLLHMVKDGRAAVCLPTLHPHSEEVLVQSVNFKTFDLGGHETARCIWKDYTLVADGLFFLVDAADRTRFAEACEELDKLLADEALQQVPVAILGNKIDVPTAASEDELRYGLGLHRHMTAGGATMKGGDNIRPIELFMVSVVKRMGYKEAFEWLAKMV